MAILFRNISDLTVGGMTARLTVYSGAADRIRVEIAPFSSDPAAYTDPLTVTVTYNGESKNLSADPFVSPVSAVFTAVDELKTVTVSCDAGIVSGGVSSDSVDISWKGDGSVAAPVIRVASYSGLVQDCPARIEWEVDGVPKGYRAYTIGMWLCYSKKAQIAPEYTRSCLSDQKTTALAYEHSIEGLAEKHTLVYRIAVGLYPEDTAETAARDDYVLYLELDSPAYVCSGNDLFSLAPHSIRCSGIQKNRVVVVKWETLAAAVYTEGYNLDYSYNGSDWTNLFWDECESKSYPFTVPEDRTKVAFRVKAYSNRSKYEQSAYIYSSWLEIGKSNVYVGHGGHVVPAAEIYIGSRTAAASLNVG